MRLETRFEIRRERDLSMGFDEWLLFVDGVAYMTGKKRELEKRKATLKRRDYLSSISAKRESQRRELKEGVK